jgi:protein-disulfide isomerase
MRAGLVFLCFLLLCACSPAPAALPTPVATQTPAATATPPPNRYASLPQAATALGFPQLGFPSAPVSVVLYSAPGCTDCLLFQVQVMPALIGRIRAGEVLLTFVPLSSPANPAGEGIARAAYCASEQNAFWDYLDALYGVLGAEGMDALTAPRLSAIADAQRLDLAAWQTCLLSQMANSVLTTANDVAAAQFGGQQFVLALQVNNEAAPPDRDGLMRSIDAALARVSAAIDAAIRATNTPSLTSTVDPQATAPVVLTLDPLLGEAFAPPLTLDLPTGWQQGNDTLLLDDVAGVRAIPFTLFTGPIEGGIGSIVLLWRFPNVTTGSPLDLTPVTPDLYADGLRLLRLAIVEPGCNVGTDIRREYSVGGLAAVGTQFSAVTCPELPDTRGWFAGLRWNDINYIFYVYADPITAMDAARPQLQAILDSVRFEG